ncbi:hypothetical protein EW026_g3986 [Hermanssonia centrifuga]|uniref:Uncharacterized protein n=1 Tax=Hermanssonia centrifuga TaxID=98765 RepID=A0A4S4KJS4_9APHY|nr:hypothetical protein EW026_g3986 [Hermanssonia centrifuga]
MFFNRLLAIAIAAASAVLLAQAKPVPGTIDVHDAAIVPDEKV